MCIRDSGKPAEPGKSGAHGKGPNGKPDGKTSPGKPATKGAHGTGRTGAPPTMKTEKKGGPPTTKGKPAAKPKSDLIDKAKGAVDKMGKGKGGR